MVWRGYTRSGYVYAYIFYFVYANCVGAYSPGARLIFILRLSCFFLLWNKHLEKGQNVGENQTLLVCFLAHKQILTDLKVWSAGLHTQLNKTLVIINNNTLNSIKLTYTHRLILSLHLRKIVISLFNFFWSKNVFFSGRIIVTCLSETFLFYYLFCCCLVTWWHFQC